MNTILIIDGNNLANCAYFKSNAEDENWTPEWTSDIFVSMLGRLQREFCTDNIYIAWDEENGTAWRKEILPEYKATRSKEGKEKLVEAIKASREIDIYSNFIFEGFEGDDVVFGLCKCLEGEKIIISADKDFLQLVQKGLASKLYNPLTKSFREIPSIDVVLEKSIAGDNSDNLKGIPHKGIAFVKKYVEGKVDLTEDEKIIIEKHRQIIDLELNPNKEKLFKLIENQLTNS